MHGKIVQCTAVENTPVHCSLRTVQCTLVEDSTVQWEIVLISAVDSADQCS